MSSVVRIKNIEDTRKLVDAWHIRLEEEKKKLQDFYLVRIREALQLTDTETLA